MNRIEYRKLEALDKRWVWFLFLKSQQKGFQIVFITFDFDENPLRRIIHPADQFQLLRQPEDEWPEPDALNRAANGEFQAGFPGNWIDGGCLHSPLQYYTKSSPALNLRLPIFAQELPKKDRRPNWFGSKIPM